MFSADTQKFLKMNKDALTSTLWNKTNDYTQCVTK